MKENAKGRFISTFIYIYTYRHIKKAILYVDIEGGTGIGGFFSVEDDLLIFNHLIPHLTQSL